MNYSQILHQQPTLAAALREGLHVLEMPLAELSQYAEGELTDNPLLELGEAGLFRLPSWQKCGKNLLPYLDEIYAEEEPSVSVREHLLSQIELSALTTRQTAILEMLIECVDPETGLLPDPNGQQEAGCPFSQEEIEAGLQLLRSLDPPGICAASVSQSIIFQLERKGMAQYPTALIVAQDLKLVAQGKLGLIARKYGLLRAEADQIAARIRQCRPYPTTAFSTHKTEFLRPDVLFLKDNNKWQVEIPNAWMDELRISQYYEQYFLQAVEESDRNYLREQIVRARGLISNIARRHRTLKRVAEYAMNMQQVYLNGSGGLCPLMVKDAAKALSLSASTVSRAIQNKSAATPSGMISLRALFAAPVKETGLSSQLLKKEIAQLLKQEPPLSPMSDARIQAALQERGISISRRGIAKYRMSMCIPNRAVRKQKAKT